LPPQIPVRTYHFIDFGSIYLQKNCTKKEIKKQKNYGLILLHLGGAPKVAKNNLYNFSLASKLVLVQPRETILVLRHKMVAASFSLRRLKPATTIRNRPQLL